MSHTLVLDRIESNLTRLRLPRIREILEQVLSAAEKQDQTAFCTIAPSSISREIVTA